MEEQKKEEKKLCPEGRVPVLGLILVAIGVIFLIQNIFSINVLGNLPWDYIWPTIIILLGAHIIYKKSK